jgi:hypothetical protein
MLKAIVTVHATTGIEVTGTVVSYAEGWIVVDAGDCGLWHINPDQVVAVNQCPDEEPAVEPAPPKRTKKTKRGARA